MLLAVIEVSSSFCCCSVVIVYEHVLICCGLGVSSTLIINWCHWLASVLCYSLICNSMGSWSGLCFNCKTWHPCSVREPFMPKHGSRYRVTEYDSNNRFSRKLFQPRNMVVHKYSRNAIAFFSYLKYIIQDYFSPLLGISCSLICQYLFVSIISRENPFLALTDCKYHLDLSLGMYVEWLAHILRVWGQWPHILRYVTL